MEQKETDNIELRSEKVRNVIGKVLLLASSAWERLSLR